MKPRVSLSFRAPHRLFESISSTPIKREDLLRYIRKTESTLTASMAQIMEQQRAKAGRPAAGQPRVVIVGAGLAGLSAAYELRKHFDVTILESAKRVGGRVHTLRKEFGKAYAEVGGEWIHPAHRFVYHYLNEFRLNLDPDPNATAFLDDAYLRPLKDEKATIPGLAELMKKIERHTRRISYFVSPEESPLKYLDKYSFLEFLKKLKASAAAIAYLRIYYRAQMTVELEEISALHALYEEALPQNELDDESRIEGGNWRLPDAFRRVLKQEIRLQATVTRVEHTPQSAKVFYQTSHNERPEFLEAEHIVIAVPANQVRHITFVPSLPKKMADAYQQIELGRQMKIVMRVSHEVWQTWVADFRELFDEVLTNRQACFLYQSSHGAVTGDSLLTAYVAGRGADELRRLPTSERARTGRRIAGEVWKTALEPKGKTIAWCWCDQPRIGGSYAFFAPGQMTKVRPLLGKRLGRIHFAGEHTAIWQGYMNGAIESGLRAASEIDSRVKRRYSGLLSQFGRP